MLDLVARATLIAFFGSLAALKAMAAIAFLEHWPPQEPIKNTLELGSQLAGFAFILLILFMTLVRLKPLNAAVGWEPRFSALMGTFLTCLLPLLPETEIAPALKIISIMLVVCGFSLSIWVTRWLGRSLSVTAQARRLITRGPYAIVRHPLYLTEEVAVLGLILSHLSLEAILLGAVQWAFQLRRMANEERVMRSTFSEYEDYANKTPKLFPSYAFRTLQVSTSPQELSSSTPAEIQR
jgi:protein-S-isoprenylcysteine O-methyltransferase Ste14